MEFEAHGVRFVLQRTEGCWEVVEPVSSRAVYKGLSGDHKLDVLDQAKLRLGWAGPAQTRDLVEQAQKSSLQGESASG